MVFKNILKIKIDLPERLELPISMLRKPSCVGIPDCELHWGMYISLFSDRNEEMELDLREGLDLLANVARKGEKDAH